MKQVVNRVISPTGAGVRGLDKHGEGKYGAGRGNRLHRGADYICTPGQDIVSPIKGVVVREARPYASTEFYSGLLIRGMDIEIKMFYLVPDTTILGMPVEIGTVIGIAQDISERYSGMTPHIHLEIVSINPELLINFP